MLKYIFPFFWAVLLFSACSGDKTEKGIIPKDQIISLLTEVHLIDGGIYNVVSVNPDTLYKYGNGRFLTLFKTHHVDSVTFRKSLKYYSGKPAVLEAMYEAVLKRITDKIDSTNKELLKTNNDRPKI